MPHALWPNPHSASSTTTPVHSQGFLPSGFPDACRLRIPVRSVPRRASENLNGPVTSGHPDIHQTRWVMAFAWGFGQLSAVLVFGPVKGCRSRCRDLSTAATILRNTDVSATSVSGFVLKLLVIGATGRTGGLVTPQVLARGYEVTALPRQSGIVDPAERL